MNSKVKIMVTTAMVTAVICVLAPLSIPIGPVPISLTLFAIYLGLYAIGWKWGTVSILLYILIGLVGLPVYSNFSSGIGKLLGPTGGYIFGFIFVGIIAGLFIDLFEKKIYMHAIGMVLGVIVCYLFGTIWFAKVMEGYTFATALDACVYPFIPADIIKMVIALIAGPAIRKGIKRI